MITWDLGCLKLGHTLPLLHHDIPRACPPAGWWANIEIWAEYKDTTRLTRWWFYPFFSVERSRDKKQHTCVIHWFFSCACRHFLHVFFLSKTSHLWGSESGPEDSHATNWVSQPISDGWIPILDAETSPEIPIFSGRNHPWNQAAGLAPHRVGLPGLELCLANVEDFTRRLGKMGEFFQGKSRSFPKKPGFH